MADPHWTSYVGMASGLAGAIMGNQCGGSSPLLGTKY